MCAFSRPLHALIALELGGSVAAALLIVMAEGYHRQPFAYLGIVLAVLTFAGSLSFVRLLERRV